MMSGMMHLDVHSEGRHWKSHLLYPHMTRGRNFRSKGVTRFADTKMYVRQPSESIGIAHLCRRQAHSHRSTSQVRSNQMRLVMDSHSMVCFIAFRAHSVHMIPSGSEPTLEEKELFYLATQTRPRVEPTVKSPSRTYNATSECDNVPTLFGLANDNGLKKYYEPHCNDVRYRSGQVS